MDLVCIDNLQLVRVVNTGARLQEPIISELINLLRKNHQTFAWSVEDIQGIILKVISHELQVDESLKPIK